VTSANGQNGQSQPGAGNHESANHIEVDSLRVTFGRREIMKGISCSFPRRGLSVLMGGSGSGKSTLLRMISGLQAPDSGSIRVAGDEVVGRSERQMSTVRSRLGMLFQNGALLDSMTVFDNVALPLREHTKASEGEIRETVRDRLDAVGLGDIEDLLPGELSGGMLRRAALARAIVREPEILLCDEPFSGLDPPNVRRIESLLVSLNKSRGLTMIVTSHHVSSARRMSDQIVLLVDGIAIAGTPMELAVHRDKRVTDFLNVDARGLGDPSAGKVDLG